MPEKWVRRYLIVLLLLCRLPFLIVWRMICLTTRPRDKAVFLSSDPMFWKQHFERPTVSQRDLNIYIQMRDFQANQQRFRERMQETAYRHFLRTHLAK